MVRDTSSGGGLTTCQIWKAVLNDKKVTARTRFVTDGRTDGQTDHYRASATLWLGPN
jgi:hypothetical protein